MTHQRLVDDDDDDVDDDDDDDDDDDARYAEFFKQFWVRRAARPRMSGAV